MQLFINQQSFFEAHASDADIRINQVKPKDTTLFGEQYRHFLDIDDYPNFKNLDRNLNHLLATYGWNRVKENGTNPWTLVYEMDSLTAQLKRGDWNAAYMTAADIGHYVGDPHQPLHATRNYNGQETNNSGIHSRYESSMVKKFKDEITFQKDSVHYIDDVYGFAFAYLLHSNSLIDSIFHADNIAKAASGGSYSDTYYAKLWELTGDMTKAQMQSATIDLASLWYTAWVNAGLLQKPTLVKKKSSSSKPESINLYQNYPNPFNPKTTIQFDLSEKNNVALNIFSLEGKEIAQLMNGDLDEGNYVAEWDASQVSSGVYFYQLQVGEYSVTKKLLLLK